MIKHDLVKVLWIGWHFRGWRLFLPLLFTVLTSFVQAASVTSIGPFLAIATNSGNLSDSYFGQIVARQFSDLSDFDLLFLSGALFVLLVFLANSLTILSTYLNLRMVWDVGHAIREHAFAANLAANIDSDSEKNSSDSMKLIVTDTANFTTDVFQPYLELIARFIFALVLISVMVAVSLPGTLLAVAVIVVIFAVFFRVSNGLTQRLGKIIECGYEKLYSEVKESIDNFDYVKFSDSEKKYISRFTSTSQRMSLVEPKLAVLSHIPRYFVETIGATLIITVALFNFSTDGTSALNIPTMGIMLFATYRLIPLFQQMYANSIRLKTYMYCARSIYDLLSDYKMNNWEAPRDSNRLHLENRLLLQSVSFSRGAETPVLSNVNLCIQKGQSIGIQGPSGSGKSTLIKILTGLHRPVSGTVLIDDTQLVRANSSAWRRSVGYVPQQVRLKYGSISENVAFESDIVDEAKIRRCCQLACIAGFIESNLERGYATVTGDGDGRFSGGQKQRIALARALYRDPDLLILDESMSGLDQATEDQVFKNLQSMHPRLTILCISHQLSTINTMHRVFKLDASGMLEVS